MQEMDDSMLFAFGKNRKCNRGARQSPSEAHLVPERYFSRVELAQLILACARPCRIAITSVAVR